MDTEKQETLSLFIVTIIGIQDLPYFPHHVIGIHRAGGFHAPGKTQRARFGFLVLVLLIHSYIAAEKQEFTGQQGQLPAPRLVLVKQNDTQRALRALEQRLEGPATSKAPVRTHSQGKALAAGAETKAWWHNGWHDWRSLQSGAWGKRPCGGRTPCITYDSVLRQVLLKLLLWGHVDGWNDSWVLEVSGTFKQQRLVTKGCLVWAAGVPAHRRHPLIRNGDEPVQKDPGGSSAPSPVQQVGHQALGGPMASPGDASRREETKPGDPARGHPPSAGRLGVTGAILHCWGLRWPLQTHHAAGYWGDLQQGGNAVSELVSNLFNTDW